MKTLILVIATSVALGTGSLAAEMHGQGNGKKHGKQDKHDQEKRDNGRADSGVAVRVVFVSGDVTIIRNHYEPRYRNLPRGLQKKLARGGALPPGWQKKFEPFPVALERRLSPLPDGYRRGVFEGHAVIYNPRTNVLVDFAVLF